LASELAHAAGARGLVDDAGRGAGEEAHVVGTEVGGHAVTSRRLKLMGPRLSHSTIILEHRFLDGRSDLKFFVKLSSSPIGLTARCPGREGDNRLVWRQIIGQRGEGAERRKRAVVGAKFSRPQIATKKARAAPQCDMDVFESVFLNARWIVLSLAASTMPSSTTLLSNRRKLQRAYPSGGF
jgi:hypothetical protein